MKPISTIGASIAIVAVATTTVLVPAPSAGADGTVRLRGIVERMPGTPDGTGVWTVGGRSVQVTSATRIEGASGRHHGPRGYWVQTASGVVVHAPSWPPALADAAGFRPAVDAEADGVAAGRAVEVKGRSAAGDLFVASEIELRH
jgi:hypothetical protein